jgi:NAD(P)H dehydrogenase (quinone)
LAVAQTFKHAIIAAHPSAKSFTLSVAERYAETVRARGHEAVIRDLYRMGFDPVLREQERQGNPGEDVVQEWALLGKVDVFVLVYPIWFGTPPAMLKGYIDRVFGAGRTLGWGGEGGEGEVLSGKRLVSLTSSGSMRAWLDEKGVLGSLRNVFDRYLAEVFGFAETARYHFDGIARDLPDRDARMHLKQVENAACECLSRMGLAPPDRDPNPRQ